MRTSLLRLLLVVLCCTASAQRAYVPALPGYHYQFPRDHFSHPDYQTEWWYYTGNLRAKDGHRFGFELTFFRQGVSRVADPSPWYLNDLFMAHLALSDLTGHHYYATERLNRAGPGIAGVDPSSGRVWNGNWQTVITTGDHKLRGIGDNFNIDLDVTPQTPPIMHGIDGVSQKSAGTGHASHYISFPRMNTVGTINLNGTQFQVEGDTWMDHEFFTDTMGGGEVGWDWLSLQLDDHSEIMLSRLRHQDGSVDPYSSGTYIDPQGKPLHLALADFQMTATGALYRSPATEAAYPIAWSVSIPSLHLQLTIETPLPSQEFISRFGPSYWEGAVDVSGQRENYSIHGSGYLEMTGYANTTGSLFSAAPK